MKVAIITTRESLFRSICQCFTVEASSFSRLSDEGMIARALYREEFDVIFVDASAEMSLTKPLLSRRECFAMQSTPLIVVGGGIYHTLQLGAHEVMLEPIDSRELLMRVQLARIRARPQKEVDVCVEYGLYTLDKGKSVVYLAGRGITLTTREFAIAWLLFSHAGNYVSRRQIANTIWGGDESIVGRTLEQHIYKLRKKLELNGEGGICLRTMYAYGYRIETTAAVALQANAEHR